MLNLYKKILYNNDNPNPIATDIGLLVIRVAIASFMVFGHGLGKLMSWGEMSTKFPDPLGIGSPASFALVIMAEFLAAAVLITGFMSRLAVIPLIVTMAVAGFIIHGADPFKVKELAMVYLVVFSGLFFTGPGRFSLDAVIVCLLSKGYQKDKTVLETTNIESLASGLETSAWS